MPLSKSQIREMLKEAVVGIPLPGRSEDSTTNCLTIPRQVFQSALVEAVREAGHPTDAKGLGFLVIGDLSLEVGEVGGSYGLLKNDGIPRTRVPEPMVNIIYSAQERMLAYAARHAIT